jgi:hypothetical protein
LPNNSLLSPVYYLWLGIKWPSSHILYTFQLPFVSYVPDRTWLVTSFVSEVEPLETTFDFFEEIFCSEDSKKMCVESSNSNLTYICK